MTPSLTVRSEGFRAMCGELARLSGKDYADVLRSEAATVVKMAALESPVASAADIRKVVIDRDSARTIRTYEGEVIIGQRRKGLGSEEILSINLFKHRGREWFIDNTGETKKYMVYDAGRSRGWHVPDIIWGRYQNLNSERPGKARELTAELLKRRGLERLSWLQIGDGLGVALATVAPAGNLREAVARGATARGRTYANGTAAEASDGARFQVSIENASPIAIKRWGQKRIEASMNRRRRGFDIAMKKRLFENLELRAKRYPGIFVKPE
jgi:hypothetical protein